MSNLILMVGLPRSGKTTWALAWWRETGAPIVSPDAIRLALHGQRFQALAEPFVWAIAKVMVRALFAAGHPTVTVDATNTTRKRRDEWRDPAWEVWFHEMGTSAADCRMRARAMGDEEIIATIDRMEAAFEPVTAEERGAPSALQDEDVYRLNETVWRDNPADSIAEAKRRLAPAVGRLEERLAVLLASWRAKVEEGFGPTDRIIGIKMCADELEAWVLTPNKSPNMRTVHGVDLSSKPPYTVELPLLGSNQDSPDPESGVSPGQVG